MTSTFELKTDEDVQQLPSTMQMQIDSTIDYNTENDGSASMIYRSPGNEQVVTVENGDYNDYYHILQLAFVHWWRYRLMACVVIYKCWPKGSL